MLSPIPGHRCRGQDTNRCRSEDTKRRRSGHLAILLLMIAGALAPDAARAIEWSLEPYVTARTIYNDNFTLTTDPHSDVWGILLAPGVKLNAESEIFKVTGEADVSVNRYSDSQFNTTEGMLLLRSDYRAERNTYGLNFHFIRDNTLVGELATTGVAQAYSPRTELLINPSWTRALTESTRLKVDYGYTQVNYGETTGTSLIDFSTQLASVGLEHQFSERDTGTITAAYELYETDPSTFRAETASIIAGWTHDFSEKLRGTVFGGPRHTYSKTSSQAPVCLGPIILGVCQGTTTTLTSDVTSSDVDFTFGGELTQRWTQIDTATLRVSRELNPSGIGALVQTDQARLVLSRELTATLAGFLDLGFYRSKYIGATVAENKANFVRVEPHVNWRIDPQWTLEAGYIYARQKYESQPLAATANVVYLAISYNWRKIVIPR